MQSIKSKFPINRPQKKSIVKNLVLGDKLNERALAYSEKSGLKVTALLRNGLDLLLKQNNF